MAKMKFFSVHTRNEVEVDIENVEKVILKNGRLAGKAIDPESGTEMFKILTAEDLKLFEN